MSLGWLLKCPSVMITKVERGARTMFNRCWGAILIKSTDVFDVKRSTLVRRLWTWNKTVANRVNTSTLYEEPVSTWRRGGYLVELTFPEAPLSISCDILCAFPHITCTIEMGARWWLALLTWTGTATTNLLANFCSENYWNGVPYEPGVLGRLVSFRPSWSCGGIRIWRMSLRDQGSLMLAESTAPRTNWPYGPTIYGCLLPELSLIIETTVPCKADD